VFQLKPSERALNRARLFIVVQQRGVQIDLHATNQRLNALHEARVESLEPIWMAGNIAGQET
jgi:hypothetical protein